MVCGLLHMLTHVGVHLFRSCVCYIGMFDEFRRLKRKERHEESCSPAIGPPSKRQRSLGATEVIDCHTVSPFRGVFLFTLVHVAV